MASSKVTIVGAGNIGATAASVITNFNLADVVLIDVVENIAKGKAIDISESASVVGHNCSIIGTSDWEQSKNSDVVIIASGKPRHPGMSRTDLLETNAGIVIDVARKIKKYTPESLIIVVTNPLDAMAYAAFKAGGFAKSKVMGMSGQLDGTRYCSFIASKLHVDPSCVHGIILGVHGNDMLPLPRFTTIGGIPLVELMPESDIQKIIERTKFAGAEIVNLLGYSGYYAAGTAIANMAQSLIRNSRSIISCSVYCEGEYGIKECFMGVPVVLGGNGVEKIIEISLLDHEKQMLSSSVDHVKGLINKVDNLL
ncbi:MAG: malate dehydrogenase [Planctomycetaceae bacterium]|nr:malate dehydrogenase [Planctomycetaceae bacterium]